MALGEAFPCRIRNYRHQSMERQQGGQPRRGQARITASEGEQILELEELIRYSRGDGEPDSIGHATHRVDRFRREQTVFAV